MSLIVNFSTRKLLDTLRLTMKLRKLPKKIFSHRNIANLPFFVAILLALVSSYDGTQTQPGAMTIYEPAIYHLKMINNHTGAFKLYKDLTYLLFMDIMIWKLYS